MTTIDRPHLRLELERCRPAEVLLRRLLKFGYHRAGIFPAGATYLVAIPLNGRDAARELHDLALFLPDVPGFEYHPGQATTSSTAGSPDWFTA